MTIVGDATTWSVTSDDSRGVIYDRNVFTIQVTGSSTKCRSAKCRRTKEKGILISKQAVWPRGTSCTSDPPDEAIDSPPLPLVINLWHCIAINWSVNICSVQWQRTQIGLYRFQCYRVT